MNFIRNVFLTDRFFYAMGGLTLGMMLSYGFPFLMPVVMSGFLIFVILCLVDFFMLFAGSVRVSCQRETAPVLSLGDDNPVIIRFVNHSRLTLALEVIDELPEQFQIRNFSFRIDLPVGARHEHKYFLRPVVRGEYRFGEIQLYLTSILRIIKRRISTGRDVVVPVYPSIIQMKKYELKTMARTATEYGVKKVRRVGHSYEFEHIKPYQRGDDYRSVNWKATGRRAQLMVNQYEDERSQQVYCIIDKSRVMHMPFNGLSLLDYAVNASLVISNIVLGKQDKAGLITFADKPHTLLKANRSKVQLKRVLESLYREEEAAVEANYESLYMAVRQVASSRSLLFLYTNFESTYALQRVLPQLRKLNNQHLLVVVFFENTEIIPTSSVEVANLEDMYTQITAEHYALTKIQLAQQLKQFGILTMLTRPENLTVNTINRYLELKSRGMI
ncbi:MAG TPA: DUF58 domain-containing protein [Chryseosolibacter sp.]|nr:DUF58 domain-containing protein [Chryseosolibacter sp.]